MEIDFNGLIVDLDSDIAKMSPEERHTLLLELEQKTDMAFAMGRMDQEEAWDSYFGLLHECDESHFENDRARILAKIDTKKYNPFKSKNPEIVMLARIRATGMGLLGNN